MPGRPNILLVMIEQFSAFADPRYAACCVRTPALERLAERSIRFARAYCNAPVCGPSRLSFLTGRYACHVDAFDNGSELPGHIPTFAHMLSLAGYHTAMCGRMHIHGMDQHRGFERRLSAEIINPLPCTPGDFPGRMEPIRSLAPATADRYAPAFSDSPMYRHDDYVTRQACAFLTRPATQKEPSPFCLVVGYLTAHSSFKPYPGLEPLYRKYIMRADLPLPDFTRDDYARLPEHAKRQIQYHGGDQRIFSAAFQRHETAWYLARVEYADRQIGLLLDALETSGLADNTAVIVTADHGESMGRHGVWGKMNFYEAAQRIPLYVALPGRRSAAVVEQPVSLVDLLPTLAELADCDIPFPVDGRSLLQAGAETDKRVIFSEYHGYQAPGSMYMALRGTSKYCHHLAEPCELYDLTRDPGETENRIDAPAYAEVRDALVAAIRERVDIARTERRLAAYNAQRETVYQALIRGRESAARIRRHIGAFRASPAEPWWDGGAYMAADEPASINPLARDAQDS